MENAFDRLPVMVRQVLGGREDALDLRQDDARPPDIIGKHVDGRCITVDEMDAVPVEIFAIALAYLVRHVDTVQRVLVPQLVIQTPRQGRRLREQRGASQGDESVAVPVSRLAPMENPRRRHIPPDVLVAVVLDGNPRRAAGAAEAVFEGRKVVGDEFLVMCIHGLLRDDGQFFQVVLCPDVLRLQAEGVELPPIEGRMLVSMPDKGLQALLLPGFDLGRCPLFHPRDPAEPARCAGSHDQLAQREQAVQDQAFLERRHHGLRLRIDHGCPV